MDNHLSKLKQLLDTATLDDATRNAILETVVDLEGKYLAVKRQLELETEQNYNILHGSTFELKAYASSVLGYSRILVDGRVGELSTRQKAIADGIVLNAERLLAYVDSLRDLNRIKAEQFMPHPEIVDICAFLDELKANLAKRNIELIEHCAPDVGSLNIDRSYLALTLEHLLYCDHDFQTPQTIELVASRSGNVVRLAFTIHPIDYKADRILDVYHRLAQDQLEVTEIMAMRVSVAYQLCNLIGGNLIIEKSPNGAIGFLLEFDAH
ncbi:MAG: hypothetical protein L0154_08125 [Chloroflexi bacterium]|nr:hypothetical protein [Chloroflexota bacterium]